MLAAEDGNSDIVRVLAEQEKKSRDDSGKTALMHAAEHNHLDCVKILAPLEERLQDSGSHTALMIATEKDNSDIVRVLASRETGTRDRWGRTALMLSARTGAATPLLFPFEAGLADKFGQNQTWYAASTLTGVLRAIRFEKTVGWLLEGKTILEARVNSRSVS